MAGTRSGKVIMLIALVAGAATLVMSVLMYMKFNRDTTNMLMATKLLQRKDELALARKDLALARSELQLHRNFVEVTQDQLEQMNEMAENLEDKSKIQPNLDKAKSILADSRQKVTELERKVPVLEEYVRELEKYVVLASAQLELSQDTTDKILSDKITSTELMKLFQEAGHLK